MAEGSLKKRWLAFPRWQRWSFVSSLLLSFYTILGFFVLPAIVRSQLETKLTVALHRQTTVAEVKINPFTLQCAVNGFQILGRDNKADFVGFDPLQLNVQTASLFKLAIIVKSISLVNPSVNVALYEDLSWNFSDLLVKSDDVKEVEEEEPKKLLFSINNIEIIGGKFRFDDQVEKMTHDITDLHLAIPYVSDLPSDIEIFIQPAFEAVVNGTAIGMKGGSKPFHASRHSEIDINFTDIDLTKYLTYLPDDLGFSVHSGLLDLTLAFNFLQHEDGKPAVKIQGTVGLREVDIRDRQDQPILSFPEMTVDADRVHIMRKEFHLSRFFLREPSLSVERLKNGEINLATLFPASGEEEKTATATGDPLLFTLKEAVIDKATIHFTDQTVAGPFQTTLQPLNIQVDNFSTAYESKAEFLLAFASESGEEIEVNGGFSSLPLQVNAALSVRSVKLDKYRPYYQGALAAELKADKIDARANVEFAPENHIFMVTAAGLDIGNLTVAGDRVGEKIVIPHFAISDTTLDLTEQKVFVGQCASSDGVIPLIRRKDGSLNVSDFLVKADSEEQAVEPLEDGDDAAGQWILVAKNIDFTNYSSTFTDQVPDEAVLFTVDNLGLSAANITNGQDEKGRVDLDLRLNETASVKVGGSISLAPLGLALDIGIQGLPFKAAQPYIDGKVNAIIGTGTGGLTGSLSLARADEDFAVNFHGNVDSQKLSLLDLKAEKVLSWESFLIRELDVTTKPMHVSMETIVVDGVESFVSVNEDGQLNLASLAADDGGETGEKPEEEPVAPEEAGELVVEIAKVELLNSSFDFKDLQVSPPYSTSLRDIQGQVTGLSSGKDVFADIDISAKLDRHSPMTITGKIHPWQDFFTDLTVGLHDVELSPMSPYSLKFIGYPLSKGKLSLDLHYLVDGKKLSSENKAFIDQITLGDFVENDTATSLPVQLAISLLKNRAGEIDLSIPVSGELDDPEFSVAGVVFTVIKNLLVKAATSPFALLGSLFPDNRDFLFVEFDPGVTDVVGRDDEQWSVFAKAMYDHPALKLEITGFVDPETDRTVMTKMNFDRQLKVQKLKDLVKKKQAVSDVDEIVINPEEYEKYLKKAYKAATFKRPRNFIGLLKGLPPDQMEKLIYEHIVILDDDLHQLGMARASIIKDYLVENGPIEPERIFLLQPQNSQPDEDLPVQRVEIVAR